MRKSDVRPLGLVLALGFFLAACVSHREIDQLAFGAWAAEKDLWDEAIFRWKKVLQENPSSASAHNNLAVAYEKKGLWEEAKKEYEIALKLAPKNPWIEANFKSFQLNLKPPAKDSDKKGKEDKKKTDEKNP